MAPNDLHAQLEHIRTAITRAQGEVNDSGAGSVPANSTRAQKTLAQTITANHIAFGERSVHRLATAATHELYGAGFLQQYIEDPEVTDILVNDVDYVWVDKGHGLQRVPSALQSPEQLRALAVRLAAQAGARLDDSSPAVDGRLRDGTRLHALLHPLCESAAIISLRTFRQEKLTLTDLVNSGAVHPEFESLLRAIVKSKLNFLISGATGTGKTTLLSSLLSLVPASERIVTIEESREIRPAHPHVISLETKKANVEGHGAIDQAELVRNALRMRPDRVVVGECRGAELREMLAALNTGHDGGCGTVHANSSPDVVARLHAMGALAGMAPQELALQAVAALDLVIHVRREPHATSALSSRYIEEVSVVHLVNGQLAVTPALTWEGRQTIQRGTGYSQLQERLQL